MRESSVRVFLGIFFTFSVARSQLPTALPCSIRGVALVGGDLADSDGGGGFAAEDAAECQYECDRRANCNFWSHVDEWKVRLILYRLQRRSSPALLLRGAVAWQTGHFSPKTAVFHMPQKTETASAKLQPDPIQHYGRVSEINYHCQRSCIRNNRTKLLLKIYPTEDIFISLPG